MNQDVAAVVALVSGLFLLVTALHGAVHLVVAAMLFSHVKLAQEKLQEALVELVRHVNGADPACDGDGQQIWYDAPKDDEGLSDDESEDQS